ncbi:hypothetical protein [Echinicola shivajiensis]|uniref:hypothetical protein n=1 Tax=Echinicola shivajiensis TaxID=1035916 RepID=UPI001BFC007D|nr:hypothetical protein [Echinicola shivajiensis]
MLIEEVIYDVLSNSTELSNIFGANIFPLVGSEGKPLPILLYQINQVDVNHTKTSKSLQDGYLLKINVFSEDYKQVIDAVKILKELLDFKSFTDEEDNVIIDLVRFSSYTDEFEESSEVYFRNINFELLTFN